MKLILQNLKHDSIVQLLHYFIEDHRAYLVLEYIEGETLQELVDRFTPLPLSEICRFAISLSGVLAYLHGRQPSVVHGDFAPDNVMVTKEGRVKLIDFMVACEADPESNTHSTLAGKPNFMAPAQYRGYCSTQSDIYSLGGTISLPEIIQNR